MTTELVVKKTIGWLFLLVGIMVILYTALSTINYFTGVYPFPELFVSSETVSTVSESSDSLNSMIEGMLSNQINSFISKDSINLILNMTAWSLFAFFMVYLGAKVFELGLKVMKE
ncbi:MAG: hypothetical protein PHF88_02210 [Candidatus Pacebacteria bacterium]|nr:hypothetical protein [Candidatus Paceibacterota bacterium]